LVAWTVRFLIALRSGSGPLEHGNSERAKLVSRGNIKTAKQLFEASSTFIVSDNAFKSAFSLSTVTAQYLARYYLAVLETERRGKKGSELAVPHNSDLVNLEHVMPQTREPNWKCVSREDHSAYVKRLGNLALIDKDENQKIGNDSFKKKRAVLSGSDLLLTKEIGDKELWTPAEISARQEALASLAVKAWPLKP